MNARILLAFFLPGPPSHILKRRGVSVFRVVGIPWGKKQVFTTRKIPTLFMPLPTHFQTGKDMSTPIGSNDLIDNDKISSILFFYIVTRAFDVHWHLEIFQTQNSQLTSLPIMSPS